MFANPLWSVLLLLLPIALYFGVIKPRLKAGLTTIYADAGSMRQRVWARAYAFRTFWIATTGVVVTAAPDILVQVAPLDFSPWLPQPWPAYTGPACTATIALMKALETKPREDQ